MNDTTPLSEKRWFSGSSLDYIVFDRGILFNSVFYNSEATEKEPLGFAVDSTADFHVALHLAKKEKNPDPLGTPNRVILSTLGTDVYPICFMKFTDFTRLYLLNARPVEAMSERLKGNDPLVTVLKLPPAKYSKKYWVAYRIIE